MLQTQQVFIALNLEIASIRRIAALQRSLRSSLDALPVVWVAPPNLHITLRYLGNIDLGLIPAMVDGLEQIVQNIQPMRVRLEGLLSHPSLSQSRILLLEAYDDSGIISGISGRIEQLVESFGFKSDPRPFLPRVILARSEVPIDATRWFASLGSHEPWEGAITECALYGADSEPGQEYHCFARLPLPVSPRSQRPRARLPSQRPKPKNRQSEPPASTQAIPSPPRMPSFGPPVDSGAKDTSSKESE